jgi:hypothetical protein
MLDLLDQALLEKVGWVVYIISNCCHNPCEWWSSNSTHKHAREPSRQKQQQILRLAYRDDMRALARSPAARVCKRLAAAARGAARTATVDVAGAAQAAARCRGLHSLKFANPRGPYSHPHSPTP